MPSLGRGARSGGPVAIALAALLAAGAWIPPLPAAPESPAVVGAVRAGSPANSVTPAAVVTTTSSSTVQTVAAGAHLTCAVRADGTLGCWGLNAAGESVPPGGTFTAVSGNGWYDPVGDSRSWAHDLTCAISGAGSIVCWGDDGAPARTPPAGTFTALDVRSDHGCAIRSDATVACWGSDWAGAATPPAGTFLAVSVGEGYSCGVRTDGTLACWGSDAEGAATPPAGVFTAVGAGSHHVCAIRDDGTLACWGSDADGRSTPPTGTFTGVDAGDGHTCAVRTNGALACWGRAADGQTAPPTGTYTAVSAGQRHSCAVRTDGRLTCWGYDGYGQVTMYPKADVVIEPRAITQVRTTVVVRWAARPALSPVGSYDVSYRRGKWDGSVAPPVRWRSRTTDASASFRGTPGYGYVFSVVVRYADGRVSVRPGESGTTFPLDDRSLLRSPGWFAGTGPAYYHTTYLRTSTCGATLTKAGVVANLIVLVYTRCPTCGRVEVYLGSRRLKTVNLYASTVQNRYLLAVWADYEHAARGTLRIKVISSGKKVMIDGVGVYNLAP